MNKFLIIAFTLFSFCANAQILDRVKLDVPTVKQGKALCGPATIEMIFRYWGINKYNQLDIAYNILTFNPEAKRVKKSGILETPIIDWGRYPGTGTSTMREFLKQFSNTKNHKYKHLSSDPIKAEKQKYKIWKIVQQYLSDGIPVIVHQYWKGVKSTGHYRVVTGYDNYRRQVFLNDADPGRKITQSYDEFFKKWNVNEPWLHYNAIAFNVDSEKLNIKLKKYYN
ncbi:MAG: C39 family peptidase [Candidatus Thiodiazotropha sp.]